MSGEQSADSGRRAASLGGRGVFYGWYVMAASCLAMTLLATIMYSFGAFFAPLSSAFNASRAATSALFAITMMLFALFSAVAGELDDHIGARPLVIAGGLLVGLGVVLASRATGLWMLELAYCLGVGLGGACIYTSGLEIVDRWFVRRRAFALGIAVGGFGAGTLIGPPVADFLIAALQWRATLLLFGLVSLVAIPAVALLLVESPQDRGLRPDGDPPDATSDGAAPSVGATPTEALQSRSFWLIYAGLLLSSFALFMAFAQFLPFARDLGIHRSTAALLLGLIGVGNVIGRVVLGNFIDRVGHRWSMAAAYGLMAVMMTWWLVASSVWSLAVFALGFGLGYGVMASLIAALAGDYFGLKHVGSIVGLLITALAPGALLGPILAGVAFDLFGAYTIPIAVGAVLIVVALGCTLVLTDPGRAPAIAA